jgi:hypothetical protein
MTPVFFVAALVWSLLIALPLSAIAAVIGKRRRGGEASVSGWAIFRKWLSWLFPSLALLLFLVFCSVPTGRP